MAVADRPTDQRALSRPIPKHSAVPVVPRRRTTSHAALLLFQHVTIGKATHDAGGGLLACLPAASVTRRLLAAMFRVGVHETVHGPRWIRVDKGCPVGVQRPFWVVCWRRLLGRTVSHDVTCVFNRSVVVAACMPSLFGVVVAVRVASDESACVAFRLRTAL